MKALKSNVFFFQTKRPNWETLLSAFCLHAAFRYDRAVVLIRDPLDVFRSHGQHESVDAPPPSGGSKPWPRIAVLKIQGGLEADT